MIKLIHAADFHLDAPFSALTPEQAAKRREEQRELPDRLADLCERERAGLVLLAGDIFDSNHAYSETVQALARALGRMRARVFIAPGNHDYYAARSPWTAAAWPENVHIFTSPQVESVALPELGCVVHGASFTGPACETSPLSGFRAPEDGNVHLMVLHGDVEGRGRYGSIQPEDIAGSGLAYLALGHIHACSGVRRTGETDWAYPGCPEGRGFDELGEKGVLAGTVGPGGARLDFVPMAGRRYEILTVELSDGEDPAAALEAALPRDADRDIYRILLTGESALEGLDLAALEAVARPRFYSVSLRDQTRVRRDLWSREGEDTLTGLFLRELRGRIEAAESPEERETLELAVRFGLAALENREEAAG